MFTTRTRKAVVAAAGAMLTAAAALVVPASPAGAAGAATGTTLFGTTVYTGDGTPYSTALARQKAKYGSIDIMRTFYIGLPKAWPGNAGMSGGPVSVSFEKVAPKSILAGTYDAYFTDWFATAPRDRKVFWTYWHEPEDNIAEGEFTAADYRAAFVRLDKLADKAANPNLRTTTIMMNWTLNPMSKRRWQDYYPGNATVDVVGFDCYNRGDTKGIYQTPQFLMDNQIAVGRATGKPLAIPELGSVLVKGDTGTRRAQWLRDMAAYARANNYAFVTYYDSYGGAIAVPEFRLFDSPSIQAWTEAVNS